MNVRPGNRRLGVLLSGRGSNFQAIADRIAAGSLQAEIAVVISNVENAAGLANARQRGLTTLFIPSRGVPREEFDRQVLAALRAHDVSLVVLAGFMRIFSPVVLEAFPYGILNIHPSLLPSFPGKDAQKDALEHGVKFSGCTVHFVDGILDGGPIVTQAAVPVADDDTVETLSARILKEEHRIFSEAIEAVLSGCEIQGRRVICHR